MLTGRMMLITIRALGGTMRTTTAAIAAVLLLGALTACSDDGGDDAKPPAESSAPAPDPDETFLAAVEAAAFASWEDTGPTDEELVTFPPLWCGELEAGHSVAYLLDDPTYYPIGQDWGTAKPDAQELIVLGTESYCPDMRDQVVEELRASGAY